jgi:tRNA pseudouridine38-40 synthase
LERYSVRLKEKPSLKKMREAALLLEGEHDFKAFCAVGSSAKTSVRKVYSVKISAKKEQGATVYRITVCGNGFLYNMVRIIAGHLFAIGCGTKEKESILLAYQEGDRALLGKTMPAKGLTMVSGEYEQSPFVLR